MCISYIVDSLLHILTIKYLIFVDNPSSYMQAETDRIANEIQRKKEKEKQEFYEEKAKMVSIIISMQEFDSIKQNLFPLTLFLFNAFSTSACFSNYFGSYPLPQTAVGR